MIGQYIILMLVIVLLNSFEKKNYIESGWSLIKLSKRGLQAVTKKTYLLLDIVHDVPCVVMTNSGAIHH